MRVTEAIGFDGGRNPFGLMAVANSITNVVNELIPGNPPFGNRSIQLIRVEGDGTSARVLWAEQDFSSTAYRIHLKTQTSKWQQMAFQLSHELAHVKMGPARTNLLIEVIANATSLEALTRLRDDWKTNSPFAWDGWMNYADGLHSYRQDAVHGASQSLASTANTAFRELSIDEQVQMLAHTRNSVESLPLCHAESRSWQVVAADTLIRTVLNNVEKWSALHSLAIHTDPPALDVPRYRDDLRVSSDSLPVWLPNWLR